MILAFEFIIFLYEAIGEALYGSITERT